MFNFWVFIVSVIYIEGREYQVNQSSNLLEVCLSLGFDLPYFCWHPVLGSVGSCRQCAVKQYQCVEDTSGRIVMSCMVPVIDGLLISIYDNDVQEFRKNILELLMINHPHDCPVCAEGGNCHLQDMTVMTGHSMRRYHFMKRTHYNQNLGPFISHEMNRCINCYRCIRYYKEYAGGCDLGVYGTHDNLYFGRFQEGKLESEFSGNLIEICPTGVFTDKTYSRYYTRKWDVQFSPSICSHCSVGCNIILGERYGKLCRVENRYNERINGHFLCDRGRFGYDYVNNMDNRFKTPLQKRNINDWVELSKNQVISRAVNILHNSNTVIGIGSTRASIESNFALKKLVGSENFYIGVNRFEHRLLLLILNILKNSGISVASVKDIEDCDAILLLGEDITQTNARIALAIRQAIKGNLYDLATEKNIPLWHKNAVLSLGEYKKNSLFITSTDKTKLDDIASWTYYASLDDQARFGFAVANILDNASPVVADFDNSLMNNVEIVAQTLLNARKPLIISGSNVGSEAVIFSVANIAKALKNCGKDVSVSLVTSDVNSIGLAMLGGGSLNDILDLIKKDVQIDSVIILECDLHRHMTSICVDTFLKNIKNLIVLDHQKLPFYKKANLIFSSASIPESDGTLVNYEGRAQRFFRTYNPNYYDSSLLILESWRWLYLLYNVLYSDCRKNDQFNFDDIIEEIANTVPIFSRIHFTAPNSSFRIVNQKLARAPHRYSGRTAIHANINVHEPRVFQDYESMFTFSMEGHNAPYPSRQHFSFAWSPGWNSCQAWNKFYSEIGGGASSDCGVHFFDYCDKNNKKSINWFTDIPIVSSNSNMDYSKWCIVPYWHIFGSDEMSQRTLAIQYCMPEPYVVLNRLDAVRLNIHDKKNLIFICEGEKLSFPLVLSDNLAHGCIGLPIGFPGVSFAYLGMYVKDIEGMF